MKKNIKKLFTIISLFTFFPLISSNFSVCDAAEIRVTKQFIYDRPKGTNEIRNIRGHKYISVPSYVRPNGSVDMIVGHESTFHIVQRIFYYTHGYR